MIDDPMPEPSRSSCSDLDPPSRPDLVELVELVGAARDGDASAFARLVARFEPMIGNVALGITRNPEDAADVAQQTWLILFTKIGTVQSAEALPGWLSTTARREALKVVRERSRHLPLDENGLERLQDASDLPEHEVEKRDLAERVRRALQQLPRQRGDFLIQLVGYRRPYDEVAARFRYSRGSLGPLRARYLRELSEALEVCGGTAA
jgi:RNA polymerase sigma factor (sigma-70 family)